MALPTKQEESALEAFRPKVADVLTTDEINDDMFLLRWLRARDLNLEKAEVLLRNAKKWRKENNLDSLEIDQIAKPYYRDNFPTWVDGVDKEGRPVCTIIIGKWNITKIVNEGKSQEVISYMMQIFERVMQALKICNKKKIQQLDCNSDGLKEKTKASQISQFVLIVDWNEFAWSQLFNYHCCQTLLTGGSIYEGYYPEILHSCYFINCPRLISVMLALMKPVVAAKTMAKIKCFGTDMVAWRKEILQYVDEDQLRPVFGGTRGENQENPFALAN